MTKFLYIIISLIFIVSSSSRLLAKPVSIDELKKIQSNLKSFNTLSVNFTQKRFIATQPKLPRSAMGTLKISQPMFRYTIKKKPSVEWIYDGTNLFQYYPEQNEALKFPANKGLTGEIEEIVEIFLNSNVLFEKYSVVKSDLNKEELFLKLKPKKESETTEIDINMDTGKNIIKNMVLYFKDKNKTEFVFNNPSKEQIKSGVFSLDKSVKIKDALK